MKIKSSDGDEFDVDDDVLKQCAKFGPRSAQKSVNGLFSQN